MRARTLFILVGFLLFLTAPLSRADNEITGPDMGWGNIDSKNDSTTAVSTPTERKADPSYYDLQGRKVTTPVKGHIYIHQGRKIRY